MGGGGLCGVSGVGAVPVNGWRLQGASGVRWGEWCSGCSGGWCCGGWAQVFLCCRGWGPVGFGLVGSRGAVLVASGGGSVALQVGAAEGRCRDGAVPCSWKERRGGSRGRGGKSTQGGLGGGWLGLPYFIQRGLPKTIFISAIHVSVWKSGDSVGVGRLCGGVCCV